MKILDNFINLISYKEVKGYHFVLPESKHDKSPRGANNVENEQTDKTANNQVFPSLDVNKDFLKKKFNFDLNSDIKLREFAINIRGKQYSAFLFYIEGMIDSNSINNFVIKPLMLKNFSNISEETPDVVTTAVTNNVTVRRVKKFDPVSYILECLVPQNDVTTETRFQNIIPKINAGVSALFIDTISTAFLIDAKGFEKRSVSPPENENIIRGAQEGFIESLRTNTTLLRRIVNNEEFIIEEMTVGEISRTQVALCYLKNVANDDLVKEVRYRINNIGLDYLISSRST